jgi:hypothetical protein
VRFGDPAYPLPGTGRGAARATGAWFTNPLLNNTAREPIAGRSPTCRAIQSSVLADPACSWTPAHGERTT